MVYDILGNYAKAVDDYNKAIELNPNHANAYYHRGIIFGLLGDYEQEQKDIEKAKTLHPDKFSTFLDEKKEGIEEKEEERFGFTYPFESIEKDFIFKKHDKRQDQLAFYNKTISLYPNFVTAYYNRAILYFEKGEYDKALLDLNKCIKIEQSQPDYYFKRSLIYRELGDKEKEIRDLETVIRLKPDFSDAYFRMGMIYFNSGNYDYALKHLGKSIELSKNNAEAFCERGKIKLLLKIIKGP